MEEFKVGEKVTVKGKAYLYGEGTILKFVQSKAVIQFHDGVAYIPLENVRYSSIGM